MRYEAYIFDLYGTLADVWTDERDPALWRKTAAWYKKRGAVYTAKELRTSYLKLCGAEQQKEADPLYEIELRRVFAALYEEKGVSAETALVEETAVFFRTASRRKLELYPWVLPVFDRIRKGGAKLFLLSNAQACFTNAELKELGIDRAFDGIVLSSDAGVKKPSPKIMRKLLDAAGLEPSVCLMTGNDRTTDVALAQAFHMDSLYVETATSLKGLKTPAATRELLNEEYEKLPELLGL